MSISWLNIYDSCENPSFITPWSFIHLLSGALIYLYLKGIFPKISVLNAFLIMIILHTLYEIKDLLYYFKIKKEATDVNNNSLLNSVGDTFFSIIGFFFASFSKKVTFFEIISFSIIYIMFITYFFINKLG